MEQKKILWVILSVSLFVLVIFGIALFLYSPSRNSATAQAGGETIPYEESFETSNPSVDPDLWARDPDQIASLDRNAPVAAGNIINLNNLNIISPDGQINQSKSIDVSELTSQTGETESSSLPKELAEQLGIDTNTETVEEKKPEIKEVKKEEKSIQVKSSVQTQPKKTKIATAEKKNIQKQKLPAKSNAKPKPKTAPTKPAKAAVPQIQTLYWVQIASLASRVNAELARETLAAQHMKVEIFTKETSAGLTHRVRVGPFMNNTEASYWLKNIQKINGFETSYVTEEKVKTNT